MSLLSRVGKMAAGVGGLEIAFLIIGFFFIHVSVQADANEQTALSEVKPENLVFMRLQTH